MGALGFDLGPGSFRVIVKPQVDMALLCKGTNVMTDADGTCRRVEDLVAGDVLFDPLAQKLVRIVTIVPWIAGADPQTAPVLIKRHGLNDAQPDADFLAPQTLELFVARIPKGHKVPVAQRLMARDLVDQGLAQLNTQGAGVPCYLVLTESAASILTNGVLAAAKAASAQKRA